MISEPIDSADPAVWPTRGRCPDHARALAERSAMADWFEAFNAGALGLRPWPNAFAPFWRRMSAGWFRRTGHSIST